jgi:hypothetical protein
VFEQFKVTAVKGLKWLKNKQDRGKDRNKYRIEGKQRHGLRRKSKQTKVYTYMHIHTYGYLRVLWDSDLRKAVLAICSKN